MSAPGERPPSPADAGRHEGDTKSADAAAIADENARASAAALAAHAADLSAPLAEFGCGTGSGGAGLAAAGFACIDGFDPSEQNLRAAAERSVYRRLVRADLARPLGIEPGAYGNAAAIRPLDPARLPPSVLDAVLAILPPGGCFLFALPGTGASVGAFRARVLELCEHFVAEPVFREEGPRPSKPGLQSTVYVLKKR